jgi:hypothetical protein
MSFKIADQGKYIVTPKGVLIAYPIDNGVVGSEGLDLGHVPEAKFKIDEEVRERYSSRDATKTKAVSKIAKSDYTLPVTLLSVSPANLALLFRGQMGSIIQADGFYDAAAPLEISAPASLDRVKLLGKRSVSVTKLAYNQGTEAFMIGRTVTGGTSGATGKIAWVEGDETDGELFLVDNQPGAQTNFVAGETITGSGENGGAAKAASAASVERDIVLTDEAKLVRYKLGTDYGLHWRSGSVSFVSSGSIAAEEDLLAQFDYAGLNEIAIHANALSDRRWEIHILPDSDPNELMCEFIGWNCSVKNTAEISLITESQEEITLSLEFTLLTDGPNATADDPVFRLIAHHP